jgi:hypothetical protein
MQSSIYNNSPSSPRHHSSPTIISRRSRPQPSRSRTAPRGESIPSPSDIAPASLLRRKTMANDKIINGSKGDDVSNGTKPPSSEVNKIRRNSLYMTFNAPQVDDYVCDLILVGFRVINPFHNTAESFLVRGVTSDPHISHGHLHFRNSFK